MRRIYTSTAHFRAPFDTPNVSFAGLGIDHSRYDANQWPAGRSYWTTHFYRAPYQAGYYQSGALRGADGATAPAGATMPPAIREYAVTGRPPSAILRDLGTVSNQIPRWAYFAVAVGAGWMGWRAWKADKAKRAAKAA